MQLVRYQTIGITCQEGKKRQIASASGRCPLGPEGEGGTFDGPALPPLDSLPTLDDQGSRGERVLWTRQRRCGWRSAPIFAKRAKARLRKPAKRKRTGRAERGPLDPKEEVALVGWLKKRVRVH